MADPYIKLDDSRAVLLTGGSGGGIASFILGDQIKEKLKGSKFFFKFRIAPISGFIFKSQDIPGSFDSLLSSQVPPVSNEPYNIALGILLRGNPFQPLSGIQLYERFITDFAQAWDGSSSSVLTTSQGCYNNKVGADRFGCFLPKNAWEFSKSPVFLIQSIFDFFFFGALAGALAPLRNTLSSIPDPNLSQLPQFPIGIGPVPTSGSFEGINLFNLPFLRNGSNLPVAPPELLPVLQNAGRGFYCLNTEIPVPTRLYERVENGREYGGCYDDQLDGLNSVASAFLSIVEDIKASPQRILFPFHYNRDGHFLYTCNSHQAIYFDDTFYTGVTDEHGVSIADRLLSWWIVPTGYNFHDPTCTKLERTDGSGNPISYPYTSFLANITSLAQFNPAALPKVQCEDTCFASFRDQAAQAKSTSPDNPKSDDSSPNKSEGLSEGDKKLIYILASVLCGIGVSFMIVLGILVRHRRAIFKFSKIDEEGKVREKPPLPLYPLNSKKTDSKPEFEGKQFGCELADPVIIL
ncbi:hypothetical protein AAMO2058_001043300 [Amorphochlora amoebiformis]